MSWRRIAPWVIGLVALVAIFINLPRISLGLGWLPDEVAGIEFRTVLGLDLEGGQRVTLEVVPQSGEEITDADLELTRDIIERRVAGIGVSEPQVRSEVAGDGSRRIVVEVPGVSDPGQVRVLVGSTGRLQFIDPGAQSLQVGQDITELLESGAVQELFDGSQIQQGSVAPAVDAGNQIGVQFTLSDAASDTWCTFTSRNVDRPGPIALDAEIITAPRIQGAICGGQTIITIGPNTPVNEQERTNLYNTLRFGALPLSLEEQGFEQVDPTLGAGFLVQALIAGAVGLLLVLFFMIAYYRLPGVLAAIALIFYTLVVYAIFRTIHVTLTLAGVAAFILSIGMAVDANILIFERMKEEIRAGKTLGPAIEAGFNRAWSSILDSNVSSLLVAGWLYWQGTTVVRGFALVLIIGVLVSMFSAVTVTRTLLRFVTRTSWGRRLELYHVER
jgi:preprotein translocase subunit SecD